VTIKGFDVNMAGPPAPNPAPLEIYVLPYVDPGDRTAKPYQMVLKGNITGAGFGKVTSLPTLATPVMIPAGATYSFYITVANRTLGTTLGFNRGSGVGSVAASDDHLEIGEGYSLAYPFGTYTADMRWNGESCFMFATLVLAS
jgi:hypothetical protein